MGSEALLIGLIAAGFAVLAGRGALGWRRRARVADARGLEPAPDLRHLPPALGQTVLFAVGDGGHEQQVLIGEIEVGERALRCTQFELRLQRDVRGEWGYLDAEPPFRLMSPLTVVAFELPEPLAPLLVKRRGRAERVVEEALERYRSLVDAVRDLSTIDRAMAVAPPPPLPARTTSIRALDAEYLIWAADPDEARRALSESACALLRSAAVGDHELVLELREELMLVYCATDGALSDADAEVVSDLAARLCDEIASAV